MKMLSHRLFLSAAASAMLVTLVGCAGYEWTSAVPEAARTVAVPTFQNESDVIELGAVMSRQVLREFQREGTFSIRRTDDAALEVQGIVRSLSTGGVAYDRRSGARFQSVTYVANVDVSVIDKRRGRVLIDNRRYNARASATVGGDLLTARRDASGRIAEDLARQVVDDVLNLDFSDSAQERKEATK